MSIDSVSGKYALVLLVLGGFIYPTAAGIIRADSEPIGPNAVVPVVSLTETALVAPSKAPKAKLAMLTTVGPKAALGMYSDAPAKTKLSVNLSAYSSTPEETDDTPFITAMGTTVRDGIIATNILPFGTKVRIPKYYGDKVFVVEDRMHPRMTNGVDIWMPSKTAALTFGRAHNAEIEVLQ